jgi:Pentapeptide repeats (9 copies)
MAIQPAQSRANPGHRCEGRPGRAPAHGRQALCPPASQPITPGHRAGGRLLGALLLGLLLPLVLVLGAGSPAAAITAPELRSQRSLQDLQPDMHGRNLRQQEFLKADLQQFNFSDSDLRGAVFNGSNLQEANLQGADLENVVAYATRFEGADLRDANLRNGMLMQSHFRGATIEGADFSDAVLDLPERKALCARASGSNSRSGIATRDSLECR